MTYPTFAGDIARMNEQYGLAPIAPSIDAMRMRLEQFKDILDKEFCELVDIQGTAEAATLNFAENGTEALDLMACAARHQLAVRVELADLLGDIIVYCASEAARWNIPLAQVLFIIMMSNTSKLGADGKPIINPSNGKFEKGPNYWKPEPWIEQALLGHMEKIVFHLDDSGVVKEPHIGTDEEIVAINQRLIPQEAQEQNQQGLPAANQESANDDQPA